MSYYGDAQWPAGGQPSWDHQTPPTRSGASSTIPREETAAFWHQFEEVERAIENLVKSGKMFGMSAMPGGRREFQPPFLTPGPARFYPGIEPRGPGGPQRPHSIEFEGRPGPGGHPSTNLQNFYASQRHQPSRGSNEAEQMMQHKRRMAAQRERELRNYHQEQQFNRTSTFGEVHVPPGPVNAAPGRPDRTLSPGNMSEDARRDLIARQRSALYGEGPFADTGGYVDETGQPRQGLPGHPGGPSALRGASPLAYEYGRNQPAHPDATGPAGDPNAAQRSRTSSNASPQSNPPGGKGPLEQANRTSNSSPGGGSSQNGKAPVNKAVAPIGTRPSAPTGGPPPQGTVNPSLSRQSTTPMSPLNGDAAGSNANGASANMATTGAPSENSTGLGNWGQRGGPWGSKAQTSVWG